MIQARDIRLEAYMDRDGEAIEDMKEELTDWGFDYETVKAYLSRPDVRTVRIRDGMREDKVVAAMDCLVPGIGEIIGGSQREDDYDKLKNRMDELGLNADDYGFYMDLRKYGSTRHAGFGLGFERCVMYLTGMGNIRDVIPFPRTVNNCEL